MDSTERVSRDQCRTNRKQHCSRLHQSQKTYFLMQADEITKTGPATRGRLWVVSELYYPEETSTGYYLTRIAEGLVDDFDVRVLCGQPTYSARGTIAPSHEVHKGVEIFRVTGTTLD